MKTLPDFWREDSTNQPSVDIEETDTHYLMSFDLPGVKKDDIKIDLQNNMLTVSGERKNEYEEKTKGRMRSERFYGLYQRSFTVPAGLKPEQVVADYKDGVLRIAVPKIEAAQTQQIRIGEGKPGFFEKLLGHKKDQKVA